MGISGNNEPKSVANQLGAHLSLAQVSSSLLSSGRVNFSFGPAASCRFLGAPLAAVRRFASTAPRLQQDRSKTAARLCFDTAVWPLWSSGHFCCLAPIRRRQ